MVSLNRFIFLVLLTALLAIASPTIAATTGVRDAVTEVRSLAMAATSRGRGAEAEVRSLVEKAVSPMRLTNVDVAGDYAIATVADGIVGGSVLLKKSSGRWQIIQQTGGAYVASDLVKFGVVSKVASQLHLSN